MNVAFWLLFILLISLGIGRTEEPDRTIISLFAQGAFGVLLFIVPLVYVNTLVLIPRFFKPRKYWQYALIVLLLVAFWHPIPMSIDNKIDQYIFKVGPERLDDPSDPVGSVVTALTLVLSTMINLAYRWTMDQGKQSKAENQKLTMEMSVLRNQINPHFFFNTLNNLYALALEESKETPKVILKLSEMMRYSLYDCNGTYVALLDEVKYLENYIDLQQMRHQQRVNIEFKKRITNNDARICPLVLIVFLENAFKHGVDGGDPDSYVKISLEADMQEIHFQIENRIAEARSLDQPGGIGLANARKRLDLVYEQRYELREGEFEGAYWVDLRISLN